MHIKNALLALVLLSSTSVISCNGDDGNNTNEDTNPADVVEVVSGSGTISGNIFWNNGAVPDGSLLIALVSEKDPPPATLDEALVQRVDPAVLPTTFRFEDVPAGEAYYLMAFFDVDRDNSYDAPGNTDYLTFTNDLLGVERDGASLNNVNVELR